MKIKLTENKLKQIVAESVKKVLNEMSLYKGREVYNSNIPWQSTDGFKWRYNGDDKIDRYMYRLIKLAKDDGAIGSNGLPTLDYIKRYLLNSFDYLTYERGSEVFVEIFASLQDDNYTKEDLYQAIANAYYENNYGKELRRRYSRF